MNGLLLFFRRTLLVLLAVILLVTYLIIYRPMRQELERQQLRQFVLMAGMTENTATQFTTRCVEAGSGMSSRTMIRRKISEYRAGEVTFAELADYTEPLYLDGLKALDHLHAASRIVDDRIVAAWPETGTDQILAWQAGPADPSVRLPSFTLRQQDQTWYIVVASPILEGDTYLGLDLLVFDLTALTGLLSGDDVTFSLASPAQSETLRAASEPTLLADDPALLQGQGLVSHMIPIGQDGHMMVTSITRDRLFGPVRQVSLIYLSVYAGACLTLIILAMLMLMRRARTIIQTAESNEAKYRRLASIDPLTGVSTRTVYEKWLKAEVEAGQARDQDEAGLPGAAVPPALVMIDVDNFKQINDRYGHRCGDAALIRVATLLQSQCRSDDTVIRFGGDEFLLVLRGCSIADAENRMQQIQRLLSEPAGLPFALSISYGIVRKDKKAWPEVVHQADSLMYEAKRQKKQLAARA